ncbi:MAG: SulP family inorganic anion transporter [Schleiferiaceae bacterium]
MQQKILSFLDFKKKESNLKDELLSGITVALALVPEAIAFSFIAGLSPLIGLYSAFFLGLITSVFGGRPGMISGATGAIAVVIVSLVVSHGQEYVFAAVILMGVIQMLVGVLKLGKFIRLVPQSVIYGFVNGLAIVIFMAQFAQFKTLDELGNASWISGTPLYVMGGLVLLTMVIIWGLPKLTKVVPSSLMAILSVSLLVIGLDIDTKTIGDLATVSGAFPDFHIPEIPLTWDAFMIVLPYSAIMAGVGLIESLLTLTLIDEITETRGNGNRESLAQGLANFANGFFSGMGGCAMIGQSLINVNAGGRSRISGIVAALGLLSIVLFVGDIIEMIPMAALVGLMFMVAIGTFEWASFKTIGKMPVADVLVIVLVTLITVFLHNLALAVLVGVIVAALVFAWENAKRIRARKYVDEQGIKHYEIYGPLFFGSIGVFNDKFDVLGDPDEIIIDFAESRIADMSAIEAINKLTERYQKAGKKLHIRHLSQECVQLLKNAEKIVEVNILEDPHYKIALDNVESLEEQ